jgi:hypothetical protein
MTEREILHGFRRRGALLESQMAVFEPGRLRPAWVTLVSPKPASESLG